MLIYLFEEKNKKQLKGTQALSVKLSTTRAYFSACAFGETVQPAFFESVSDICSKPIWCLRSSINGTSHMPGIPCQSSYRAIRLPKPNDATAAQQLRPVLSKEVATTASSVSHTITIASGMDSGYILVWGSRILLHGHGRALVFEHAWLVEKPNLKL